jgi:hypothetical protein
MRSALADSAPVAVDESVMTPAEIVTISGTRLTDPSADTSSRVPVIIGASVVIVWAPAADTNAADTDNVLAAIKQAAPIIFNRILNSFVIGSRRPHGGCNQYRGHAVDKINAG